MANAKPVKMTAPVAAVEAADEDKVEKAVIDAPVAAVEAADEDKVEKAVIDAAVTGEGEAVGYAQTNDYDPNEVVAPGEDGVLRPTGNRAIAKKPKSETEVKSPYVDKQGNEKVFTFIVREN